MRTRCLGLSWPCCPGGRDPRRSGYLTLFRRIAEVGTGASSTAQAVESPGQRAWSGAGLCRSVSPRDGKDRPVVARVWHDDGGRGRAGLRVWSGDGVRGRRQLDLYPDPVAVATSDPALKWRALIVPYSEGLARLRIEPGIVGARALRDPALDNEVWTDIVRIKAQVVGTGFHGCDRTFTPRPTTRGCPSALRTACGRGRSASASLRTARLSSEGGRRSGSVGTRPR